MQLSPTEQTGPAPGPAWAQPWKLHKLFYKGQLTDTRSGVSKGLGECAITTLQYMLTNHHTLLVWILLASSNNREPGKNNWHW